MLTSHSALRLGFYFLRKHPKTVVIPAIWMSIRAILVYLGISLSMPWLPEGRFYLRFTLPNTWPNLDHVLPANVLGPNLELMLVNPPFGNWSIAVMVLILYVLLDALFKGWFLALMRGYFVANKPNWGTALMEGMRYWGRFIQLHIFYLFGLLLLAVGSQQLIGFLSLPEIDSLLQLLFLLGVFVFLFVDAAIIFHNLSVFEALKQSWYVIRNLEKESYLFIILGTFMLGMISIPVNWAIGSLPGLLVAIVIYSYLAAALAAMVLYIYTTFFVICREGC